MAKASHALLQRDGLLDNDLSPAVFESRAASNEFQQRFSDFNRGITNVKFVRFMMEATVAANIRFSISIITFTMLMSALSLKPIRTAKVR